MSYSTIQLESRAIAEMSASHNSRQGIAAVLATRKPEFRGN